MYLRSRGIFEQASEYQLASEWCLDREIILMSNALEILRKLSIFPTGVKIFFQKKSEERTYPCQDC